MRDGLVEYVVEETGFLKKDEQSVVVARQHTGAAGKRENYQVGVFLCYSFRTLYNPSMSYIKRNFVFAVAKELQAFLRLDGGAGRAPDASEDLPRCR